MNIYELYEDVDTHGFFSKKIYINMSIGDIYHIGINYIG